MPKRNKFRKSKGRNRRSRRYNNRSGAKYNNRALHINNTFSTIVPDRVRTNLKVAAFQSFEFLGLDFAVTYAGNDLYSPGNGSFNEQPAGFLKWMEFYQKFRVYESTFIIKGINDGVATLNRGIWCSLFPTRQNTPASNGYLNGANQPYNRTAFCGAQTAMDKLTLSNKMTTAQLYGQPINQESDFSGEVATPPINLWYWCLMCSGLSDSTNFPVLTGYVTITYYVEFYDRKPIPLTTI